MKKIISIILAILLLFNAVPLYVNASSKEIVSSDYFDVERRLIEEGYGEYYLEYNILPKPIEGSIHRSKEIVLVLDTSGSMMARVDNSYDSRIEILKKSAKKFIEKISKLEDVKLAIVEYSNAAHINTGNNTVEDPFLYLSDYYDEKEEALDIIEELEASGGTNIGDGIRLARHILDNQSNADKYIVFMTDGLPTYCSMKKPDGFVEFDYESVFTGIAGLYRIDYINPLKIRSSGLLDYIEEYPDIEYYHGRNILDLTQNYMFSRTNFTRKLSKYIPTFDVYEFQSVDDGYARVMNPHKFGLGTGSSFLVNQQYEQYGSLNPFAVTYLYDSMEKATHEINLKAGYYIDFLVHDEEGSILEKSINHIGSDKNNFIYVSRASEMVTVYEDIAEKIIKEYLITDCSIIDYVPSVLEVKTDEFDIQYTGADNRQFKIPLNDIEYVYNKEDNMHYAEPITIRVPLQTSNRRENIVLKEGIFDYKKPNKKKEFIRLPAKEYIRPYAERIEKTTEDGESYIDNSVRISWNPIEGADSYMIHRMGDYTENNYTYELIEERFKGTSIVVPIGENDGANTYYEVIPIRNEEELRFGRAKCDTKPYINNLKVEKTEEGFVVSFDEIVGDVHYTITPKKNHRLKEVEMDSDQNHFTVKEGRVYYTYPNDYTFKQIAFEVQAKKASCSKDVKLTKEIDNKKEIIVKANRVHATDSAEKEYLQNEVSVTWSKVKGAVKYRISKKYTKNNEYDYKVVKEVSFGDSEKASLNIPIEPIDRDLTDYKVEALDARNIVMIDGVSTCDTRPSINNLEIKKKANKTIVSFDYINGAYRFRLYPVIDGIRQNEPIYAFYSKTSATDNIRKKDNQFVISNIPTGNWDTLSYEVEGDKISEKIFAATLAEVLPNKTREVTNLALDVSATRVQATDAKGNSYTTNTVSVQWSEVEGAFKYKLMKRDKNASAYTPVSEVMGNSLTLPIAFEDKEFTYYKVIALDSSNNVIREEEALCETSPKINNLTIIQDKGNAVVSFDTIVGDVDYTIGGQIDSSWSYRHTENSKAPDKVMVSGNRTTFIYSDSWNTCQFIIRAIKKNCKEDFETSDTLTRKVEATISGSFDNFKYGQFQRVKIVVDSIHLENANIYSPIFKIALNSIENNQTPLEFSNPIINLKVNGEDISFDVERRNDELYIRPVAYYTDNDKMIEASDQFELMLDFAITYKTSDGRLISEDVLNTIRSNPNFNELKTYNIPFKIEELLNEFYGRTDVASIEYDFMYQLNNPKTFWNDDFIRTGNLGMKMKKIRMKNELKIGSEF